MGSPKHSTDLATDFFIDWNRLSHIALEHAVTFLPEQGARSDTVLQRGSLVHVARGASS